MFNSTWARLMNFFRSSAATSRLALSMALNVRFNTHEMWATNHTQTYCMWCKQAIIVMRRVISVVACCHRAKLCAQATRAFLSQQCYTKGSIVCLSTVFRLLWTNQVVWNWKSSKYRWIKCYYSPCTDLIEKSPLQLSALDLLHL